MPVRALPVEDFKLLSPGTGWVSTGNRLLFTTDNGEHWKDISPPNPNRDEFASVFFHDADTGWVLAPHSDNSEDWRFTVYSTVDGGARWDRANLPQWKYYREKGERGLTDHGTISFADKYHGWLSLDVEGNTLFAASTLLVTSDGGRTWDWAKEGPEGRIVSILASTDKDVWVTAESGGTSELDVSHDGGDSFRKMNLPAPNEIAPARYPTYELPVFPNSLHGFVVVTYSGGNGDKSASVLFATTDGGRTWKLDRILTNLAESSTGDTTSLTVVGSTWILSLAHHGTGPKLMKLPPMSGTTDGAEADIDGNKCGLSFLTPDEGWMNCSGTLSSTIDGGASWTAITPRHRNGVLTSDPITPVKTMQIKTRTINMPAPAGPSAPQQPTPEQIAKMAVRALPVEDFKLLSPGTGWVSTGNRLLFTTDNGAHWKDISPPNPNDDSFASVFFRNADYGWVLFDHEIQEGENPTPKSPDNSELLYVSATTDGGATWAKEHLPEWEGQSGLSGSGIITFADKLHGWISLNDARSTLFASSATLSTSDGGETWNWAKSGIDGVVTGILAVTDKDIWMVGRSGEDGSQLGVSHNGGESFQAVL